MILPKSLVFGDVLLSLLQMILGCEKNLSVYLTLGQCGEYVADSFLVIASLVSFLSRLCLATRGLAVSS